MTKQILILIFTCIVTVVSSQDNQVIEKIRENFNEWQPIIEAEFEEATELYHYAWGDNYQKDKWYSDQSESDGKFLFQVTKILEKSNLGTFVYYDNYSMSGDWYIAVDYYFDTKNKLSFVFWRMNTFQAEEAVTVEKRLYFNSNGKLIRNLESVYKMNTKEESKVGFADRDVEYESELPEMSFYETWKSGK